MLQRSSARADAPTLTPPCDKTFPRDGRSGRSERVHALHRLMAPRVVATLAAGKLSPEEINRLSDQILAGATDLKTLHAMLDSLAKRMG